MVSAGPVMAVGPMVLRSPAKRTILLELFTSEGCSSCPAAEQWLGNLKSAPGLWKDFVPLAFHVDYWDHLGWRDGWSSPAFSERQQDYARRWRHSTVYTPGVVLAGKEWREWAGSKTPQAVGDIAGVLEAKSEDGKRWLISFAPRSYTAGTYEVQGALLVSEVVSEVKAGENRGRRLTHDFVVTDLKTGVLKLNRTQAEGTLTFEDDKVQGGRRAIAIWVTREGDLAALQTVGGWLPPKGGQ